MTRTRDDDHTLSCLSLTLSGLDAICAPKTVAEPVFLPDTHHNVRSHQAGLDLETVRECHTSTPGQIVSIHKPNGSLLLSSLDTKRTIFGDIHPYRKLPSYQRSCITVITLIQNTRRWNGSEGSMSRNGRWYGYVCGWIDEHHWQICDRFSWTRPMMKINHVSLTLSILTRMEPFFSAELGPSKIMMFQAIKFLAFFTQYAIHQGGIRLKNLTGIGICFPFLI